MGVWNSGPSERSFVAHLVKPRLAQTSQLFACRRKGQYADDLLLIVQCRDILAVLALLKEAIESMIPWPGELDLSISFPTSQLCIFSRSRVVLDEIFLEVGGHLLVCQPTLMCLWILLKMRLTWVPHIKYTDGNALKIVNVLRIIARVSWGADPDISGVVCRNLVRVCSSFCLCS